VNPVLEVTLMTGVTIAAGVPKFAITLPFVDAFEQETVKFPLTAPTPLAKMLPTVKLTLCPTATVEGI